jgi:curved DNA-binding protein CbpA
MPTGSKSGDGAAASTSTPSSARGKTLYDTLGISMTATSEEVTTAYRKLALVYHPDRADGSTEKFQELQRAYELLNSPAERSRYDALVKGKPALRNFKRPAKLEKVEKPSYALLADLAFYQFEASASKLRCSFHYGDGIEFNNERGSFIGLAADGFLYWTINGRGYATQLCKADSDMALSNVRISYRSNMGLARKPLERSRAGNYVPPQQQRAPQRSAGRPSIGSTHSGGPSSFAKTTGGAPRLTEAERIKQQLRNKELHRSATKRLEMLEKDEAEERDCLELELWEEFCMLHTTLEAGMRCVVRGLPVTSDLAMFMGYMSPEQVPLMSPVKNTLNASGTAATTHEPSQAEALWVDPLEGDVEDNAKNNFNDSDTAAAADAAGGKDAAVGQQGQRSPSSVSSAPSRSNNDSDTASDQDTCRGRPTAGQEMLNRTGYIAAYVSLQHSGSSPLVLGSMQPAASASSSLGNARQSSPSQPAHLPTVSSASSLGAYALPVSLAVTHRLAADSHGHPPTHDPRTIHGVAQGSTTVHFASGAERPATSATAGHEDGGGLRKVASSPEVSRASRASLQETEQPSLTASLMSPSACGIQRSRGEATSPNARDPTAERFISLLHTTSEGLDVMSSGSAQHSTKTGAATMTTTTATTPPRPLLPGGVEPCAARDSQARASFHEAIPDPSPRRTTEAGRPHSTSPVVAATQLAGQRDSTTFAGAHTGKGGSPSRGAYGTTNSSLSPQATRERMSVFSSASHSQTLAAASATDTQGRPMKPSPPHDDAPPPATSHGHSASGDGTRIVKFRPSTAPPAGGVAAECTPEVDTSVSPRPVVPQTSLDAHKTTGPKALSGQSGTVHSVSRGESGDGCTSYGIVSGRTIDPSQEEAPRMSTQSVPCTAESTAVRTTQEGQHHSHIDVTDCSVVTQLSGRANDSSTIPSGNFMTPVESSAMRDRSGAAAATTATTSGCVPFASTTVEETSSPRIAMAPLRLSASQDGELDALPLSPNAAAEAALEKKKRVKGRVTPRYMLSTEAHARRVGGMPSDMMSASGQSQSPRLETVHAYSSMTVAEMLAEEEDFMSSFAKTKRAI